MSSPTVLLLGNYRPSLTVARSLAPGGVTVEMARCGEDERNASAHRSRYVRGLWNHTSWDDSPELFTDQLADYLQEKPDLSAVFPVHEEAVRLAVRLRSRLSQTCFVVPPGSIVETCLDKPTMFDLCQEVDVPHAPFAVVRRVPQLLDAADRIGLPCVVKPVDSTHMLFGIRKAVTFKRRQDLVAAFTQWPAEHRRLIVERRVAGPRHNVYFAAREGAIIGAVEIKIERTDRSDGTGAAVKGRTIEPTVELQEDTARLVEALGYTGVGCAQYLCPGSPAERSFLELNPRLGANYAIADRAGLPLARIALDLATGRDPGVPADPWGYRRGLRFVWTTGALGGCRFEMRQGWTGRWQGAGRILSTLAEGLITPVHVTWAWRDPLPTLAELLRPLTHKASEKVETPIEHLRQTTARPVSN